MASMKSVAAGFSLLAFACATSATFSPAWISTNGTIFQGFFGLCLNGNCNSDLGFLDATSGTQASAAFMIIGTFVLLAGAIGVVKGAMSSHQLSMRSGGIVTVGGGLATLIGVAIFAGEVHVIAPTIYSASFGLAWVAVALGIVGGALAIKSANE